MKKSRLEEIVRKVVTEAASEGKFQNYAKGTFASMIKLASTGGNKNTPPFSSKPPGPGKSGPITEDFEVEYDEGLYAFTCRIIISKNRGGDKLQTFSELRAIDDITIIKQVPHTSEENEENYYSTLEVRFIPQNLSDPKASLRSILAEMDDVAGVVSVSYEGDLEKITS